MVRLYVHLRCCLDLPLWGPPYECCCPVKRGFDPPVLIPIGLSVPGAVAVLVPSHEPHRPSAMSQICTICCALAMGLMQRPQLAMSPRCSTCRTASPLESRGIMPYQGLRQTQYAAMRCCVAAHCRQALEPKLDASASQCDAHGYSRRSWHGGQSTGPPEKAYTAAKVCGLRPDVGLTQPGHPTLE
eukprot:scaffold144056_cov29-Tisochrysis_lutea.AAC.2